MATSYQDIGAIQSSGLPSIGAVQAAGGSTPVNENLTDNLDANLAELLVLGYGLAISDAISLSDNVFVPEPLSGIVIVDSSWVNVLSDTQQYAIGYFSQYNDTLSLSDTVLLNLGFILGTEQLSLTDAVQAFNGVGVVLADSFTFSDATSDVIIGQISEILSDAFIFSDAIVKGIIAYLWITINISPPPGYTEMNTGGGAYPQLQPEIFNFSDTLNLLLSSPYVYADSFSFSDAVSVVVVSTTPVTETLTDSLTLSDGQGYSASYAPTYNDDFAFSDTITIQVLPQNIPVACSDDFAFNDAIRLLEIGNEIIASIQDELFLQDSVIIQSAQSLNSYLRRYLNDVTI